MAVTLWVLGTGGFLYLFFQYCSSSTLPDQYSVLFYFALLVLYSNWLEDRPGVFNKAYLICDPFENFFKGTVILKSVEPLEHIDSLQRTQVTMYMNILYIITFSFNIYSGARWSWGEIEKSSFYKNKLFVLFSNSKSLWLKTVMRKSCRCLSAVWWMLLLLCSATKWMNVR